MIHALFDKHRLEGAPNFRDLGGLPTADGRHIRPGRLLRCGHLEYITEADSKKLLEDYGLRTVVDLRTENEMHRHPDTVLPGVTYLRCPIFEQKAEGVTRETVVVNDPVASAVAMASKMEGRAFARMKELYGVFFQEEGIRHYQEFFRILLEQEEGAVLWHCTMGKDRCGTGAVLVETALGVPWELVLADYLYTNERLQPITEGTIAQALAQGHDPALLEQFRIMDSVHPDFIGQAVALAEALSGSLMDFIETRLEVSPADLERLRALYLE